jgi:hypothetical protein
VALLTEDADLPTDPEHLAAIRWAPRVNPSAIRRLYETDALGIVDEQQIDDVGYALYARCRSILRVTEAQRGRVTCPVCETVIDRGVGSWAKRDQMVTCPQCGWSVRWRDYLKTYQHKHLVGGGAVAFHEEFVAQFERATTARQKMLAIDRLIHVFHWELKNNPVRSAARELIYARNYKELLTFLDTLTYGDASTPGLRETKQAWNRKLVHQPWHREMGFSESG